MKDWFKVSALLCAYGLLRETRPSDPYLTELLFSESKNYTLEEYYRDAIPIGTYSYLAQLVIVFLITDFFKYKPLIILSGLVGSIIWGTIALAKTLLELQVLIGIYGTTFATEVAYFTYIYAKVDKKYYPKVTSHTRAALLVGKLVSSISSQILLYFQLMNYTGLNYITVAAQAASTIWALFLPNVKTTVYFHRKESVDGKLSKQESTNDINLKNTTSSSECIIPPKRKQNPFKLIYVHFKNAYTNRGVIQWSILYATLLCGNLLIYSYIQSLWKEIEINPTIAWNGIVEAILAFLGCLSALSAGYLHGGRLSNTSSLLIISTLSICKGCVVLLLALPKDLYSAYAGYAIFGAIYAFSITVCGSEVARHLEEDSFGLIFGINTFVALLLQTVLTILVVNGSVFLLDIYGQFLIYAGQDGAHSGK
ncbi:folate transporter 1-like [Condylostylus longicornis]|uniref:folate transporter 1-like n=1 Tax=Condylostylus longicornis TaxID=2530218 RepID=UPI00244E1BAD|nr:folate transporter 1-like [Condylostylus longicornis]